MTKDLRQQLGKEKYEELLLEYCKKKEIRLEAEIKQKEKELRRLNKEWQQCHKFVHFLDGTSIYIFSA